MKKNKLHRWIWRWHFIGGIISLPIVILLSITGAIYLFKGSYERTDQQSLKQVKPQTQKISFDKQWEIARKNWRRVPGGVVLPTHQNQATEFVSGRFSGKSSLFVNPYNGNIQGKWQINQTDMYKVRKLHGELLLGGYGTKVVELVASWMVVLLLTGLYLFWPQERGWRSLFTVRFKASRRILFRDLHAVSGFWFSLLLLLILAGGLPWTDVWGSGFKWVHNQTNTGFPAAWQSRQFQSTPQGKPLTLDAMMAQAQALKLPGEVTLSLPTSKKSVFSVSNKTHQLSKMAKYHFDRYSGEQLHRATWDDIGVMMKARLWAMAFHQGEFGFWNWWLVFFTAIGLLFLSVMALLSYAKRKRKGEWSIPAAPTNWQVGKGMVALIIFLGIFFPLFGLSVIIIFIANGVSHRVMKTTKTLT
ncbi:PepSY-associated TM helix domain-containing protein [Microscilla marina]|uniref:PepSY-associated TM helix family n=1 Tax=Microscilla marina ATCC 23134 TaxID=313606 RepID=A1ZS11_MICM2|nr:PepSY domain-containing protein [Microscilla marina]EAY26899.1 PepSY-associated TM helix family [Microscilla marina ATCC 23134]